MLELAAISSSSTLERTDSLYCITPKGKVWVQPNAATLFVNPKSANIAWHHKYHTKKFLKVKQKVDIVFNFVIICSVARVAPEKQIILLPATSFKDNNKRICYVN
jgi:hypothetical protein